MTILMRLITSSAAWIVYPGLTNAQSFNLDVGPLTPVGLPAPSYAGAAGQPGDWFALHGDPPYAFTLDDIDGNPTGVTSFCAQTGNGQGDFYFNNPISTGDDERLIDDCEDIGTASASAIWTFSGLQNGTYLVYTYAIAPDNSTYRTGVTPQGANETQFIGGVFPNGHDQGATFALHCVGVTNGTLVMELTAAVGFASCNGFQLKYHPPGCDVAGTSYCDCRQPGSAPCANPGGTDNGCANSQTAAGAHLSATGTTSPDTLVFHVTGAIPNQPGLFFQGQNAINGGAGVPFGDGLRCAGTNVQRLQVRVPDPTGAVDSTVTVGEAGNVEGGDGPRFYQFWYRDPTGGPCGSGFNLTNGYEIVW